jgi:hypothetical protein
MTRAWDELMAGVFDIVSPGLLLLILMAGAALVGALWYWWPAWVPRRWPRLPRFKRRSKVKKTKEKPAKTEALITPAEPEEAEPVPVGDLSLADRLAAEGRYAEAIRQRLRVTLGELIAARLVPPQPGWTAAELAGIASGQRPTVATPLGGATELFSEIWYGDRPAQQAHDQHMRALTDQVRAAL